MSVGRVNSKKKTEMQPIQFLAEALKFGVCVRERKREREREVCVRERANGRESER